MIINQANLTIASHGHFSAKNGDFGCVKKDFG
jgi:hypothetical protein